MSSSTLNLAPLIPAAAAPHAGLVRAAADGPLTGRTPCPDWDLHGLVHHLLFWTPVLASAGHRTAPPDARDEAAVDLVHGDWPDALDEARMDLVAALSDPSAWEGTTSMGGTDPLPAAMIGGMALGELVLHGWDLARALGRWPDWPEDVLAGTLEAVRAMAAQGREMGVFGPDVPVPADAPTLHRIVALSGRDPGWVP